MRTSIPLTKDLVLVGGGHTHALLLKAWGMNPLAGVRVTLIDPRPVAAYTGMLPGFVAGHYQRDELEIDLVRLARFAGARLVLGSAFALHPDGRRIEVQDGPSVPYDILSMNYGISADIPELPGFREHGVPARPMATFVKRWTGWLETTDLGASVVVLGAGVGGAELALAIAHRRPDARVSLVDPGEPLPGVSPRARKIVLRELTDAHVTLVRDEPVRVSASAVALKQGSVLPSNLTIGAAGARPLPWVAGSGLATAGGYVAVTDQLRSTSHPAVFATGDCAQIEGAGRPKAGVFAVRQAPVLVHNLRAALGAGKPRTYRPQKDFLRLISLGSQSAVADRSGFAISGRALWRRKDAIDRKFMASLTDLPAMKPDAPPREAAEGVARLMRGAQLCGGCGAKIGDATLKTALAVLPRSDRDDVTSEMGDDAATLVIGHQEQVITTDHLRAFSADHGLVARAAAVHALGDVHAMGAEPQAALANIVLPPMSPQLQERTLSAILDAAGKVFAGAGAEIVGGHTSEGAELSVGFTVTGLCRRPPVTLSGARAGDALILTKPIGSGTVLAGEMLLKARGADVARTWASLVQDQSAAARILEVAHAMTDVTGFGLAGHLLNICRASNLIAEIKVGRIPFLPGALELAEAGVRSSLYPANLGNAEELMFGLDTRPEHTLLFDPQTSGGLLAAVTASNALALLDRLTHAGYEAAIIGFLKHGPPLIILDDGKAGEPVKPSARPSSS